MKFAELFENVQQSKSLLNKLGIPLDHEDYQVIRGMLEKTPGWTGVFTKFHFEGNVPLEELAVLYDTLKAKAGILNRLPQPVDKYDSFEQLNDDLENLEASHRAQRLLKELTKVQQQQYAPIAEENRQRLEQLAAAFYKLPVPVQRSYTVKLRQQTGLTFLGDLAKFIQSHASGFTMDTVLQEVKRLPGAVVTFADETLDILLVEQVSYHATEALSRATRWCIRNSEHMWNSYAGFNTNNRQFTIYNFAVGLDDVHSMCGVTVTPQQKEDGTFAVRAAHWKDDSSALYGSGMAVYFEGERWTAIQSHLKGLTQEEIAERQRYHDLKNNMVNKALYAIEDEAALRQVQRDIRELAAKMKAEFPRFYDQNHVDSVLFTCEANLYKGFIKMNDVKAVKARLAASEDEEAVLNHLVSIDPVGLAATNGSIDMLHYLVEQGLPIPAKHVVTCCALFLRHGDFAAALGTYGVAEEEGHRSVVFNRLLAAADTPERFAALVRRYVNDRSTPTHGSVTALAAKYFRDMDAHPEILADLKKGVKLVASDIYSIVPLIAEYSKDNELFYREFNAVKDTVLDTNGMICARLYELGNNEAGDALMLRMLAAFNSDSRNEYRFNYNAKSTFMGELRGALVASNNVATALRLMEQTGIDDPEDYIGLEGWEAFMPSLLKALHAERPLSEQAVLFMLNKVIDNNYGMEYQALEKLVTLLNPYRSVVALDKQGAFAVVSWVSDLDTTQLPVYLNHYKDCTYDPEKKRFELHFDDFTDSNITRLYKDSDISLADDNDYDHDYEDFDEKWDDISPTNMARILELLTERGWEATSEEEARKILQHFSDDHDYDLSEDDDDFDDDEEERPERVEGDDCEDIVTAMKDALLYATESDTSTKIFDAKLKPLLEFFTEPEGSYFKHVPGRGKEGDDCLYLYLSLNELGELDSNNVDALFGDYGMNYEIFDLIEVLVESSRKGKFDPDLDRIYSECSDETYNDQLGDQLAGC